jgi:uncharacterized iron-regulated protein
MCSQHYQVVGIGEMHCCVEQHQALQETLAAPALIEQIDDIVVEFASATHQRLLDDYLTAAHALVGIALAARRDVN